MSEILKPETGEQVRDAVRGAISEGVAFEVMGSGTKTGFGRPTASPRILNLTGFSGVSLYEPEELVLAAGAGTPLAEVEDVLAGKKQQFAFEPPDLGPLFRKDAERNPNRKSGTLGGMIACNLAGPRRILAGAARDHLLGFHGVSGRGEIFKSGGRVVKNVTGFDLSKLIAGSFGTLAAITELTIKVLPKPDKTRTVLVFGASEVTAAKAMISALGSSYEVSAAAHLPANLAARSCVDRVSSSAAPVTAIRVEGPAPSVESRCASLRELLAPCGDLDELHSRNSELLWREIRDVAFYWDQPEAQIWRLSVPPSHGARVAGEILGTLPGEVFYDWGGGLLWLALDPRPDAGCGIVRGALQGCGGHATLIRAADEVRSSVAVFEPLAGPLGPLAARIKESFDPKGVLNPGRMAPDW